jgi:hypothetical protein
MVAQLTYNEASAKDLVEWSEKPIPTLRTILPESVCSWESQLEKRKGVVTDSLELSSFKAPQTPQAPSVKVELRAQPEIKHITLDEFEGVKNEHITIDEAEGVKNENVKIPLGNKLSYV